MEQCGLVVLTAVADSEQDIDRLLDKTEQGGDEQEVESSKSAFSFARVFSADKDTLEEMPDEKEGTQDGNDSWAQTLARLAQLQAAAKDKATELSGRGVRRKAARLKVKHEMIDWLYTESSFQASYFEGGSPEKAMPTIAASLLSPSAADADYSLPISPDTSSEGLDSETEILSEDVQAINPEPPLRRDLPDKQKQEIHSEDVQAISPEPPLPRVLSDKQKQKAPSTTSSDNVCGLCKKDHQPGNCFMTQSSKNLVIYRGILITEALYEPYDARVCNQLRNLRSFH
jgi:hypothetical protein